MQYFTTVSITYCEPEAVSWQSGGIDGMKMAIVESLKEDHFVLDDTADWHVCGCSGEIKIILIIQARKKDE